MGRMKSYEELFAIADRMERVRDSSELDAAEDDLSALDKVAADADRAWSGSWLGYQANVYYADLNPPPPGAHFSQEWGLKDMSFTSLGTRGDWVEYDPQELQTFLTGRAGNPDLRSVEKAAISAAEAFEQAKGDLRSIFSTEIANGADPFLGQLLADLDKLEPLSPTAIANIWSPKGEIMSRDMVAIGQRFRVPPHKAIKARIVSIRQAFNVCYECGQISRRAASHLERKVKRDTAIARLGTNVFFGHGHSAAWRELKDFVQDRLHLPWDEFNRVPIAGVTNQARLSEMLDAAAMAFIIMTAEDQTAEGTLQARMNVIHEAGLFQGRLGFTKAILLVEDGCQEFSNVQGLGQIRFPAGKISACFEAVRLVLEREGVL